MIRINVSSQPEWLDLGHGVRIKVIPCSTAVMIAARSDPAVADLDEHTPKEVVSHAFSKAVAQRVITEWEGVAGEDGNPVAPSPEGIAALLEIYPIFEAFQIQYMAKALMLDAEKNGFAPLPNGISEGANATAKDAQEPAPNALTE